jgi:subtilase family serine protease
MVAWAIEATLDVQYAHAIAPGAKIVVAATSVDETQGETGFPELMNAEKSLIDQGVGDVISQSFGTMEPDFADPSQILGLRYAYKDAAAHHVSVLAPDSDNGATGIALDGSFPLIADDGTRLAPDVVANDNVLGVPSDVYPIVGGGGESTVFARPSWQDGLSVISGNHRAQPDISMSAAHAGAGWSYQSFVPSDAGWHLIGGTSESCPLFAGVVALAEQAAGHRLGNIDPALYLLGHLSQIPWVGAETGIVDITSGNNSDHGVTGHNAGPGYDEASGWGTVDVAKFVPALALADNLTRE